MKRILQVVVAFLVSAAVVLPPSVCTAAERGSISKKELQTLVATAKTPADHRAIAGYYREKAGILRAKANQHQNSAAQYAKNPLPFESKHPGASGASRCRYLAQFYAGQASEVEELATLHDNMAKRMEEEPGP